MHKTLRLCIHLACIAGLPAIVLLQAFAVVKATRRRERWLPAVLMLSGALLLVAS
ncbi:hypothetical protein [Paracidovorax cattleyae]|uniref:Uncharacterized protein n=1 Tax=Paracidovorax cattleyae TaxID=80868 RepID=A0A1H0NYK8_9BURK|nr:hypothetical protein [Paracidovorax cattleyae]SDO97857.1 hypothetical protein SAMN04489708_105214 [Paracidovorax cattleyae]